MTNLVVSTFAARRDAELVVERLVQTHGMEREAIQVAPEGEANTVGDRPSGGDVGGSSPASTLGRTCRSPGVSKSSCRNRC